MMKSEVKMTANGVQITRVFHAPRPLVFACWAQAEKLQQWSSCKEATQCEVKMDFRVGGTFTQKMHVKGAGDFSVTGTYDEIVQPQKISYHAKLGSAMTHVTVEFFDQGKDTKVVLTHEGLPDEIFCKNVSQGTGESFDKLDSMLAGQVPVGHV